jgi:arylsulfatase A-like enzyme
MKCRALIYFLSYILIIACQNHKQQAQPNMLWITIEDLTPMLGCYGDPVAVTPTIDQLAANGVRFTNAYAAAAVCSPARSCLITGMFATTLGTQNLRSETSIPAEIVPFPKFLRAQGYYCTNNYKEDYNFEADSIWDESSKTAHWRNRAKDQPFFAVFNFETTHQSKIFGSDSVYQARYTQYLDKIQRTDPAEVPLPSYSFDTPEIRKLWARYYDNVQVVDIQIKELLDQLETDGLADNTIIFFYSDHGTGMPRGKRALYDSGTKVPLIIVAPEAYQQSLELYPGTVNHQLVSFTDFAPTMLHVVELKIPEYIQGRPFLGKQKQPNDYVFATSDRVDEAYELVRSVRTEEYRYIRNYLPHRPLIQPNYYSDQSEVSKANKKILQQNPQMTPAQQSMWWPKRPVEELYHTKIDPNETNNLADNPQYEQVLVDLRGKNKQMILSTRDSGLATEAYMYAVSEGSTPYQALQDEAIFPLPQILEVLDRLYFEAPERNEILSYLDHDHPLIQYWTMVGLQYLDQLDMELIPTLQKLASTPESLVSITAAETLCMFGYMDRIDVLIRGLGTQNPYLLLMSARAFELIKNKPAYALDKGKQAWQRLQGQTKDKWKGYDLYAYWSLSQVYGDHHSSN